MIGSTRRGVLAAGILVAAGALGRPAASADAVGGRQGAARVDDFLTRLSGFGWSGAMVLAQGDRVLLHEGYGTANEADRIAVRRDTVFDIGSLAKSFTAVTVLRLVAAGRVRLEDPVARFFPAAPADKGAITVEQLLSHTAGLDRDFPLETPTSRDYEVVDRPEALRRIFAQPLTGTTGGDFAYSNVGYVLGAAIVQEAGGAPFQEVVRREVLDPLRLSQTGFWGADVAGVPDGRLARSYSEEGQTGNLRNRSGETWFDLGGGEMISTVADLHAFLRGLRRGRLLPAALRDRMWTAGKGGYGLGWFVGDTPFGKGIRHGGDYLGFGAEIAFYPEHDLVLAHVANRMVQDLGTRHVAGRIAPLIYLNRPPVMWPDESFDLPPRWEAGHRLEALEGTYELESGEEMVISRRADGALEIAARGQAAVDLLLPASAEARALRASSSARALTFVRAALAGDTAAMTPILREGGPVADYQASISGYVADPSMGALLDIDVLGTSPYALPRHARLTKLRLRYDKGERFIHFGWNPEQDRIRYWGVSADLVGATPLQAGSGGAVVGWNIVTGRGLTVRRLPDDAIEVANSGGARVTASRVPAA